MTNLLLLTGKRYSGALTPSTVQPRHSQSRTPCLLRLPPLLCSYSGALATSTVQPRHSQSRTSCLLRLPPLLCSYSALWPRPQFSRAIRKAALRAYCGFRRFFAHIRALWLRPQQLSRAIRKAALRAYRGCRRFFAHIRALWLRPQQLSRAIRKTALTCLPRPSPLFCSYSGAHPMKKTVQKFMQA